MSEPLEDDDCEEHYELVMPFTCVRSVGGPWDDDAFCAGVQLGEIMTRVAAGKPVTGVYVKRALVDQLDLVAMRHGYALVSEPWDEHLAHVTLTPPPEIRARWSTQGEKR